MSTATQQTAHREPAPGCGCSNTKNCAEHPAWIKPKPEVARLREQECFAEHVSIKCAYCNARLEFNFTNAQDEAIELDNARHGAKWNYTQGGLACDVCSRETIELAPLNTRPAYSKPRIIR